MLFTKEQIIGIVKNLPVSGSTYVSAIVALIYQMDEKDVANMIYRCYIEHCQLKDITDTIKSVMEEIKDE